MANKANNTPWVEHSNPDYWSVDTGGSNTFTFIGPEDGHPVAAVIVPSAFGMDHILDRYVARILNSCNSHDVLVETLKNARAIIQEDRDAVFASVTVGGDVSTIADIDRTSVDRLDAILTQIDDTLSKAGGVEHG
ncbi:MULTISPECIES: hypothetical protein [Brucella]|uniref:hypothetical protein n=1 Tax=Brucella TaxID=234 RepID=UPI000870D4E8|nr:MULTISPECIES: hypothetical protein [Brucella]QGA57816.1 hypothetical protein GHC20_11890 [Brucella sp. 2280]SCD25541.1 hypothetical protein BR141012304_21082 [Brucella inopinata]